MATSSIDPKRRALGKGLESLLPSRSSGTPPQASEPAPPGGRALEIPLERIDRNPYQTRTTFDESKLAELAASIKASGVVQPVVVRRGDNFLQDQRYQLITGERRVLASRLAGAATIPAIVREVSNVQAMEMTIVENLQRADLNPIEQAHAFQRLSREFQMTQEQMAERTGKDRASVSNFLRLLKLPERVQTLVSAGELSFGHARALLALDGPAAIEHAAAKVTALHLSVRATENLVQHLLYPEKAAAQRPEPVVDPNVREAQEQLRRSLGLKVMIEDNKGKGRVIIEYSGIEDFDAILTALGQSA